MGEAWRALMHRWFGTEYVHMKNSADNIIRSVRRTSDGRPYVVYFASHIVFLDEPNGWIVTPILTKPRAVEERLTVIQ